MDNRTPLFAVVEVAVDGAPTARFAYLTKQAADVVAAVLRGNRLDPAYVRVTSCPAPTREIGTRELAQFLQHLPSPRVVWFTEWPTTDGTLAITVEDVQAYRAWVVALGLNTVVLGRPGMLVGRGFWRGWMVTLKAEGLSDQTDRRDREGLTRSAQAQGASQCASCQKTNEECLTGVRSGLQACCATCYLTDTHGDTRAAHEARAKRRTEVCAALNLGLGRSAEDDCITRLPDLDPGTVKRDSRGHIIEFGLLGHLTFSYNQDTSPRPNWTDRPN